ncbi:MAG: CheR family methyltransferase, partial [Lacipirellulaceae bacterium]
TELRAETGSEQVSPASNDAEFRVIGIGASAGGLSALEKLFKAMPAKPGLSFVVVTHLSPDFESALDSILARHTFMPVTLVDDGMEVEANHVYVIPPGKEMIISRGRLLLTDTDRSERMVLPINTFLCSLARDFGERSAAVILSGSGSDGSRRAKAIADAGGMVVVQDPESAEFSSMPRSAMSSSPIDFVALPEEIPRALERAGSHPEQGITGELPSEHEQNVSDLLRLLQTRNGVDFTNYKMGTIVRRLARRAQLASQEMPAYLKSILSDEHEQGVFYQDLLVNVTRFFRDESAFAVLEEEVFPKLLDDLGNRRDIRIWVAACATGEEAYTVAMLIHEQLQARELIADVKIFATDVDRQSLEFAAAGQYTSEQVAAVNAERLEQYFEETAEGTYRVNAELRRMLVFAKHDVLRDAPFTKIDLITCRNMLIYLEPSAQQKALSLFHFGLRSKGYLMLGSSETVGELQKEFSTTDTRASLFQKQRDISLLNKIRLSDPSPRSDSDVLKNRQVRRGQQLADQQIIAAFEQLASAHFPPSFFINESHELVYSTPGANEYLAPAEGRFKNNILEMVVPELRTVLNGALRRAMREDRTISMHGVSLGVGADSKVVNLRVSPQQAQLIEGTIYIASVEEQEDLAEVFQ